MASEEKCVKALDRHEKRLSAHPGVQGLGIVAREGEPMDSDDLAVAVYVDKKVPSEKLSAEERLPKTLEIEHRGRRHKVPVRVIEQGPVTLEVPGLESAGGDVPGLESSLAFAEGGLESVELEPATEADDSEE